MGGGGVRAGQRSPAAARGPVAPAESLPAYQRLLDTVFRAAWFRGALLFFENMDAVRADRDDPRYEHLLYKLAHDEGITLLAGHGEWLASSHHITHVIPLALETPAFAVRRACWQAHLAALGMSCEDAVLDTVAAQFRLLPAQIAQARSMVTTGRVCAAGQPQRTPTVADPPPRPGTVHARTGRSGRAPDPRTSGTIWCCPTTR